MINLFLYGLFGYVVYNALQSNSLISQEAQKIIPENAKWRFDNSKKNGSFFGNPLATNLFGSGAFNYQNTIQNRLIEAELIEAELKKRSPLYIAPDSIKKKEKNKLIGLECKFISVLNLYKSLGLIHPEMTSKSFAEKYTNIFDTDHLLYPKYKRKATYPYYSIDSKYNADLRGFLPVDAELAKMEFNEYLKSDYVELANQLTLHSEYAKYTGMDKKTFRLIEFPFNPDKPDFTSMNSFLAKGRIIRANIKYGAHGHYVDIVKFVLTQKIFVADDPLALTQQIYDIGDLKNAWSIDFS